MEIGPLARLLNFPLSLAAALARTPTSVRVMRVSCACACHVRTHLAAAPEKVHRHIVGRDGRQQQDELEGGSYHSAVAAVVV